MIYLFNLLIFIVIYFFLKESTKNAQFIVISLRENMFQLADHLVGIYKTNNRTKNVDLCPELLSMFEKLEESLREKEGKQAEELEKKGTQPVSGVQPLEKCSANSEILQDTKKKNELKELSGKRVMFNLSPTENKDNVEELGNDSQPQDE